MIMGPGMKSYPSSSSQLSSWGDAMTVLILQMKKQAQRASRGRIEALMSPRVCPVPELTGFVTTTP